jgi:hypothetical protein
VARGQHPVQDRGTGLRAGRVHTGPAARPTSRSVIIFARQA